MENEIEAKNVAEQVTSSHREQRLVQRLREWRRDAHWILKALRPNMEISIKTDWQPKYRLWRYMRKSNCEICGKLFREMEEGTISKREKLCGVHSMMTTDEIAAHHSLNDNNPATGSNDHE